MKKVSLLAAASILCLSSFGQTITTIAGIHTAGYSGDGFAATAAQLHTPAHVVVDYSGNIFFTDYQNNVIRKIDTFGIITTVAGTGASGYTGDGFAATSATLNGPNGIAADNNGNLLIADQYNGVIRKVSTTGIITTIAGTGVQGYNGDNIAATSAKLDNPTGMTVDKYGNVYIADPHNSCIRKVDASGIITTVAGTPLTPGFYGDGGQATAAQMADPVWVFFDKNGNMYVSDQSNDRVRMIDTAGKISTFAGNGSIGFSGDLGPAVSAELYYPASIEFNSVGDFYIDDAYNNRIRVVTPDGIINTVAGTGSAGYSGDGGPATAAEFNQPFGAAFDICGNLYVTDAFNNVIRKITYFTGMPAISGSPVVNVGSFDTLSIPQIAGTWSSSSPTIANVGSTGIVTGIAPGIDTITYTNMCGTATYVVTVHSTTAIQIPGSESMISVIPNPSDGKITVSGNLPASTRNVTIDIMDMTGRKVYSDVVSVSNRAIDVNITLDRNIPNGLYIIRLRNGNINETIKFSLDR